MLDSWQVKKNGDNSKEDEHSRPLGNSCFTNPAPENTTSPSLSSREQLTEVSDTECEDSGPQKDDLQRIIELMDGFKASKVNHTHLWHSFNVKRYHFNFHCTPNCKDSSFLQLLFSLLVWTSLSSVNATCFCCCLFCLCDGWLLICHQLIRLEIGRHLKFVYI